MEENKTSQSTAAAPKAVKVNLPEVKELLAAGSQFGHETRRWNPKMSKFILGNKNNIHLIDAQSTIEGLEKATKFLGEIAQKGNVIFVGTKRQASEIIRDEAIRSGSFFVNFRWAGGLLTNFGMIKQSLARLNYLEKMFEEGIQDRTKYEVSQMKKEWFRLHRLYSGIKGMTEKPVAAVIIDTKFEKGAVRECRAMRIPVVGIVDTNSDPEKADYVIPANDDAIGSIKLIMKSLAEAVLQGNGGKGIAHKLNDYSTMEIEIKKSIVEAEAKEDLIKKEDIQIGSTNTPEMKSEKDTPVRRSSKKSEPRKGILEKVQESKKKTTTKK